jgi:hypothetical protein
MMNRSQRRTNLKHAARYKLDAAAERLIGTQKFKCDDPDGPDFTVTLSRELVTKARLLGWNSKQLLAEAIRLSFPEATDITVGGTAPPRAN